MKPDERHGNDGEHVVDPKPAYRLPTMTEVASTPANGYVVVSTFTGSGGSCLGFRLAGFRTVWANEFIGAARDTYAANFPGVPIDDRDIREVEPKDIVDRSGFAAGVVDVLEGSPPCSEFSIAGKRHHRWGTVREYSERSQRTDDLFFHYARLLEGLQPRVFVAENVPGLARGTAIGHFKTISAMLAKCGYRVAAAEVDAQWLGVPQARKRIIFVGVREDLGVDPVFPEPAPYRYTVREALAGLDDNTAGAARLDISKYAIGHEYDRLRPGGHSKRYINLRRAHLDLPAPTITQKVGVTRGAAGVMHPTERRLFSIPELRRLFSFPDDFVLTGSFEQQWERLGRSVPPLMMYAVARTIRDRILDPTQRRP